MFIENFERLLSLKIINKWLSLKEKKNKFKLPHWPLPRIIISVINLFNQIRPPV